MKTINKIFQFVSQYQCGIQSAILWILAFCNIFTNNFWLFAIPGIILGGMQDMLNELRKINSKKNECKCEL
jgi:hypothetical protein